jgi:hypothetical protein
MFKFAIVVINKISGGSIYVEKVYEKQEGLHPGRADGGCYHPGYTGGYRDSYL